MTEMGKRNETLVLHTLEGSRIFGRDTVDDRVVVKPSEKLELQYWVHYLDGVKDTTDELDCYDIPPSYETNPLDVLNGLLDSSHSYTPTSDLLTKIQKGDETAYAVLYKEWRPAIIRKCIYVDNLTEEAAEDIADDTITEIWGQRHTYDRNTQTPTAWIDGIIREVKNKRDVQEEIDPSDIQGAFDLYEREACKYIGSLHADVRQIMTQRYMWQMSIEDIAEFHKIDEAFVDKLIAHTKYSLEILHDIHVA
jgi:DNA-directed RNA polymerase specialized sigma24 family protein